MTNHRVSRGRASQVLLAERLQAEGWAGAESRGASLPGIDIPGIPSLAIEVKATEEISFTGALRQAKRNAGGALPMVVYRPRGYGEEKIDLWVAAFNLGDILPVLREAGY